jgi:hypothetical protein
MKNFPPTTYKVVKNPASITVGGKDSYHVLRSSYACDPRAITLEDNLSKEAAETLKTNLQKA